MTHPVVRRVPAPITYAVLVAALIGVVVAAAAVGQYHIPPSQVVGSLLHHLHVSLGPLPDQIGENTLWNIRLPRIVLGVAVGAALAGAGALLQGVFANPLAEPGVIGVSSGSAAGAAAVLTIGGLGVAGNAVAAGAFVAGLVTTTAVYLLSRSQGRTEVVTLVLTGIAINAFAGGLVSYFVFRANPASRDEIVFWQLGSLSRADWNQVWLVLPCTLVGLAAAVALAPRVDLLALGEAAAGHLGVNVEQVRRISILVVALLAAAAVAFCGIIMFVGLVVPHLMRIVVGPRHRVLIPACAIAGAVLLVAADLAARTLVAYADLPIGLLTSIVGGPAFLILLRRERARRGGWG